MNKFKNLILIVLLFCSSLLFGQTNKINIGFELGTSLNSLYGNDVLDDNEISFGFSGGLTFQYNFTGLVSLRTNISFERKGFATKIQLTDELGNSIGEVTSQSNFDYLTIPLLARFTFGKKIHFFVNAGPYLGYLLKEKDITEAFGEYQKLESVNTDRFERLDFGITTGLGVIFSIQDKLLLTVEIRNNLGLVNISSLPVTNDGSIKTISTNLLIGIAYKFENKNK